MILDLFKRRKKMIRVYCSNCKWFTIEPTWRPAGYSIDFCASPKNVRHYKIIWFRYYKPDRVGTHTHYKRPWRLNFFRNCSFYEVKNNDS